MEWISANWIFLLIAGVFIGMHFLGYGCCGHRKHGRNSKEDCKEHNPDSKEAATEGETAKKSHGCCG
jgi:hypothetical protein